MNEIKLRSNFDVELVKACGDDGLISEAARVSTLGSASLETEESAGLIGYLMRNRHGSPFEHGMMTFLIRAPIFVWREFMRHRIGFSYNEQSGRYMELAPEFYLPPFGTRPLQQIGKPGHYEFIPGDAQQCLDVERELSHTYLRSWTGYQRMLQQGIAKEVARMCLPVATYSSAYVTCNPRSMMSFLSLRTKHEDSKFPSYPQWEINQVANKMERIFQSLYPLTHKAFQDSGRVSP